MRDFHASVDERDFESDRADANVLDTGHCHFDRTSAKGYSIVARVLMRNYLKKVGLLALFAILVSGLSGCGGNSSNVPAGNTKAGASNTGNKPGNDGSQYPPLVSAIADVDIETIDGAKFKISERKGKVLLLNLWATWCGPCRDEMPHLVEMQEKYRDQDFQVIGLNVGDDAGPEDVPMIRAFASNMKLNYELARIPDEVTNEFYRLTKFSAIPISLLIDREGRLRGAFLGGGPKVIGRMKEIVPDVVAGKETNPAPGESSNTSSNSNSAQKMELKPADAARSPAATN